MSAGVLLVGVGSEPWILLETLLLLEILRSDGGCQHVPGTGFLPAETEVYDTVIGGLGTVRILVPTLEPQGTGTASDALEDTRLIKDPEREKTGERISCYGEFRTAGELLLRIGDGDIDQPIEGLLPFVAEPLVRGLETPWREVVEPGLRLEGEEGERLEFVLLLLDDLHD